MLVLVLGTVVASTALASGATPLPLACTPTAVQNALATGGDYQFTCSGTAANPVKLYFQATLVSSLDTTIAATSQDGVEFIQQNQIPNPPAKMLTVSGGTLTLTDIELYGGGLVAAEGTATPGAPGNGGAIGQSGATSGTGTAGTGGTGGNGTAGSTGGAAPAAQSGAIFIAGGATVTLNGGEIASENVEASAGGAGGAGGGGGSGGLGGQCTGGVCTGGPGGSAGDAAAGGTGGVGGAAEGGAVYVSAGATLNVNSGTVFDHDVVYGGTGGVGGTGGAGGAGGLGGTGTDGTNGTAGSSGPSAVGGSGGQGGDAQGGAIYNAGTLNITDAIFSDDAAIGGSGGVGGVGGAGGRGGQSFSFSGSNGSDGSAGGAGGPPGASSGGAIYNAGTFSLVEATFTADNATGSAGGMGGTGGSAGGTGLGCSTGCSNGTPGANGSGGNGGAGGAASFASVASPAAVVGCATFTGDTVIAGAGGAGGTGGFNAASPTGASGAAGAAGSTGTVDPVISGGAGCPTLSVADSSVLEPTGTTATLAFTVTLSSAASKTVTVDYATSDGTALAGTDYDAASGTLTFPPGTTTQTVPVTVHDVGYEADTTFNLTLSNPTNATVSTAQAVGTIHGRSALQVTIATNPATPVVGQTAAGSQPASATATVTVTDVGKKPITNVSLPSSLTIGWHPPAPASATTVPVKQTATPMGLTIGTLQPGQSSSPVSYPLEVDGDGSIDLSALALGAVGGETVKGLGTTQFEPDSQLLVFTATLGAKVNSQTNPGLIQAGTAFLINLTLENRSNYRTIVVDPIYPNLGGNAADGSVYPASVNYTGANPTGSESEVEANPYVTLKPGEVEHYLAVVRTGASDAADTQTAVSGGTRASVTFDPPVVSVLNPDNTTTPAGADHVVMVPGSDSFTVGIDDSGMTAAPFGPIGAFNAVVWYVPKGLTWGLWRATYGAVRGLVWDLPSLVIKGIGNVSTASLDYLDRIVELWTACDQNQACLNDLINTAVDKVLTSFADAPEMLTETAAQLTQEVKQEFIAHFAKLQAEWDAGDWRQALTEFSAETSDTAVNVALLLGPAILARSPKAAAAWDALKTATYAKVETTLNATVKALEPARAAVYALGKVVRPGYWFTKEQMASIFGVSSRESSLLSALTERLGISVVLRSRASESIKFIEEGLAVMKPYWIKTKNVSQLDADFLGYHASEIGKVVIRPPAPLRTVEANMRNAGLDPADPEWEEVLSRLKTRTKEYHGEYKQMQKWAKAGKVKGKWPWGENGVNPSLQADQYSTYRFRLNTQGGAVVPEIWADGGWKFITGDIDLIAITKANGSALSDTEHVAILKQLATVLGTQHPESATWVNDGKFWFKAKENYLTNEGECCLAQYGPDGKVRAVEFDSKLSDPTNWTKLNYRIFWKGGFQAGPGG